MRYIRVVTLMLLAHWSTGGAAAVFAQGLVWSLPKEDGTWVRYEGTFQQVEIRAESNEANLTIDWIRHLWIKSVGREKWKYDETKKLWLRSDDGEWCRWIEIKLITGKPSETGIDPGPIGARICRVLVPEARVAGTLTDVDKIHVSYIPIVKGYQRIGDGEVKAIKTRVLQVYPLLSVLRHYKTLEAGADEAVELEIPLDQPVTAKMFKGEYKMESRTGRSVNKATLWRSDDVPFGLAKWRVETSRWAKDAREPRDVFENQKMSEVTVVMSAHETGGGAQSELVIPGEPADAQ